MTASGGLAVAASAIASRPAQAAITSYDSGPEAGLQGAPQLGLLLHDQDARPCHGPDHRPRAGDQAVNGRAATVEER